MHAKFIPGTGPPLCLHPLLNVFFVNELNDFIFILNAAGKETPGRGAMGHEKISISLVHIPFFIKGLPDIML